METESLFNRIHGIVFIIIIFASVLTVIYKPFQVISATFYNLIKKFCLLILNYG